MSNDNEQQAASVWVVTLSDWGRDVVPKVVRDQGLRVGVEVGTDRGTFADLLLGTAKLVYKLYCVDPYRSYAEMSYPRLPDLLIATHRLSVYGDRPQFLQMSSKRAAEFLSNVELDFVYIDGAHDRQSVAEDLDLWWPRLREGGLFSGHDFDDEHHEVRDAVLAFCRKQQIEEIFVARDSDGAPSWFFNKAS